MRLRGARYHLVGVGGSGMSGLARLLREAGALVTGSDAQDGEVVRRLRAEGIEVWVGHDPERIAGEDGFCVRSAAVPARDPEVGECLRRGFRCELYAQAVGRLSGERRTLSVGGTHGKTTTTALTVAALRGSGLDPSHLIGGEVPELGGNGHGGRTDLLVVEACEFNRSFHQLRPYGAAVLNVDHDHFDTYPSRDELEDAYAGFLARVRPGGTVLVNEAVPERVLAPVPGGANVLRVGEGLFADLRAADVRDDQARYSFVPVVQGERLPRIGLSVPGRFQMGNALFALGLALSVGAEPEGACEGISEFEGVRRRFEIHRGPRGGRVVSDYAHHPAEIRAVLRAARRRYPGRRLVVAFQPHQHRRTQALLEQFAEALADADACVIAEIYGAREGDEDATVHAQDLVAAVRASGGACEFGGAVRELPSLLLEQVEEGDVVLVLGAGDIDTVVGHVVRSL